jgi:hypothetical protein
MRPVAYIVHRVFVKDADGRRLEERRFRDNDDPERGRPALAAYIASLKSRGANWERRYDAHVRNLAVN